jgi:1-aminocyclopropane-1-carboxylate deaminase
VFGICALKGAVDLAQNVQALCAQFDTRSQARWRILHEFHCGGFARTTPALREFMHAFEAIHTVRLDPVYTGKMLFALWQLQRQGVWQPEQPLLAIHTGGVQGRRGYEWLA